MKQAWIAVAAVLPQSTNVEPQAQAAVQNLTNLGLPAKYLDSGPYTRLMVVGPTATPAPLTERSYLVYLGPFLTQLEAQSRCIDINTATGTDTCVVAQPDPL